MNSPLLSTPVPHWQARVARAFSRAAPRYDALASAQRDIGEALWQTLPKSAQQVLDLGREVNVGAGTITCNYDGVNKHRTQIGDHAFIGSNSALVAPVSIGQGATVGAGSTIAKDVAEHALAVTRSRQLEKADWPRPTKKAN